MTRSALKLALAAGLIAVTGCNQEERAANNSAAQGTEAVKEAGDKTIAAGLDQNGRFFTLAKAAGLDATLAGPGPYTVFVADDAAFAKLPAGTVDTWMKPEARPELTRTLSYQILPGTVLAEDIAKAIDNSDGKATLATMGGGTVTATKEGDKIVLTDAAGGKATITKADEVLANGVVHRVDTVLMPGTA
ncbi:MAG TPA: fasciclin domain-containing protein [Sphingomicrobium sp.]|nr:fasciclin domain-containing protein [Sphingomicrobium sp.]